MTGSEHPGQTEDEPLPVSGFRERGVNWKGRRRSGETRGYAFWTLPALRQDVHTRARRVLVPSLTRTR